MKVLMIILLISMVLGGCSPHDASCGPYAQRQGDECTLIDSLKTVEVIAPRLIGATHQIKSSLVPQPEWLKQAVIYEINVRQYSPEGTFQQVIEDLPRLKALGVNLLWLMPIHPISEVRRKGSLGSYYSIRDYMEVNPEFGSKEDLKALIDQAHALGFKVILDLVINHTGWDHEWITTHPEYYVQSGGQIIHPIGTDWEDVAQLNFSDPQLVNELVLMTQYWVREFGVDGYRADVAGLVPVSVWNHIHEGLLDVNPDVFMLAEDHSVISWFDVFHANYGGWELMKVFKSIGNGNDNDQLFLDYLSDSHRMYPQGNFPMIFTSNHDENSWNGIPSQLYKKHMPLARALTFLLPGMPLIYNGQESSLEKQLLFFEKDQIEWNDYDLTSVYQELIQLKTSNEALETTNQVHSTVWIEDENSSVLSFLRQKQGSSNKVLVFTNLSQTTQEITVHLSSNYEGEYQVHLKEESVFLPKVFKLTLQPLEMKIFIHP